MYFLITDETNRTQSKKSQFFIYGGLIVPAEAVGSLDKRIHAIRRATPGLLDTDPLKFDSNACPDHVSKDDYKAAKDQVIDACLEEDGVHFVAYLIHHAVAQEEDRRVRFALNTVFYHFNKFLRERGEDGVVVVDRFDGDHEMLREKFSRGNYFENKGNWVRLRRVKLFAATCDGASHLSSAVDVVLGAFRYCVNEKDKTIAPQAMFPRVANLMYHRKRNGVALVREYGLLMRPKGGPAVRPYQAEYDELVERFSKLIKADEPEEG